MVTIDKSNIYFEQTCIASPEQYDLYIDGSYAGYIRLRWGKLTFIDNFGNVIYSKKFNKDPYKGSFNDDEEKYKFLLEIISII